MPDIFRDNRGYVGSVYREDDKSFNYFNFIEDRVSVSHKGVVRGFHGDNKTHKLVSILYGKVKLVVHDLVFHTNNEYILTPESRPVLIRPHTLNAHQCLTDNCVLFYKWTQYYDLGNQWTVNYNCPDINPNWPVPVTKVSERDKNAPTLSEFLGYKPVTFTKI